MGWLDKCKRSERRKEDRSEEKLHQHVHMYVCIMYVYTYLMYIASYVPCPSNMYDTVTVYLLLSAAYLQALMA